MSVPNSDTSFISCLYILKGSNQKWSRLSKKSVLTNEYSLDGYGTVLVADIRGEIRDGEFVGFDGISEFQFMRLLPDGTLAQWGTDSGTPHTLRDCRDASPVSVSLPAIATTSEKLEATLHQLRMGEIQGFHLSLEKIDAIFEYAAVQINELTAQRPKGLLN
jgi:hypothetical protein